VSIQSIKVRHNVEMAHRLFLTPGKCEQIHGHSWSVTLEMFGNVDSHGLLEGLNFSDVKKDFRAYLDETFDHRLLLNPSDPWSQLYVDRLGPLPGLKSFEGYGDPTTENFAMCIGEWASGLFVGGVVDLNVEVWETAVNNSTWRMNATAH
jgi:6-pyruvoyltetrahydropterin/6-carboxytetrahydropterin synthase